MAAEEKMTLVEALNRLIEDCHKEIVHFARARADNKDADDGLDGAVEILDWLEQKRDEMIKRLEPVKAPGPKEG